MCLAVCISAVTVRAFSTIPHESEPVLKFATAAPWGTDNSGQDSMTLAMVTFGASLRPFYRVVHPQRTNTATRVAATNATIAVAKSPWADRLYSNPANGLAKLRFVQTSLVCA